MYEVQRWVEETRSLARQAFSNAGVERIQRDYHGRIVGQKTSSKGTGRVIFDVGAPNELEGVTMVSLSGKYIHQSGLGELTGPDTPEFMPDVDEEFRALLDDDEFEWVTEREAD